MFQAFKWTEIAEDRLAILKLYEPLQPYFLLELTGLANADTFIDVGANIGAYSVLMTSLGCIRKIHAFEPSHLTFEELAANVEINACSQRIEIHKLALSETEKNVKFGIVKPYSGANSVIDTSIHARDDFESEVTVKCAPLDSTLNYRDRTISLKIDVEGHEKAVLIGARNLLTKNRGLMQIEKYNFDDSDLLRVLSSYDYKPVCHIGPDHYFTNIAFSDKQIVDVFEKAAERLIKSNFSPAARRDARLTLPGGITVEVSGALGKFARKFKRTLMRSPARPTSGAI
jgi:FkbM family methyltransferase